MRSVSLRVSTASGRHAGNRTQQVRAGSTGATAGTIDYVYDAANRITSTSADTTAWAYDAAGNQTQNGITGQTMAHNAQGAVTGIGGSSYTALGQGNFQQLTRTAPNASYLNTPLGLAGESIAAGNRAFTRDSNGTAVSVRYASATHYYVKDAINSVVGLFSRTGTYLGGYTYSPYGEQRATGTNTALTQNSLRYISGYHDTASGLYKLGARYYDPSLGRFTQMDPSGQESNPYSYAACNPINASDPTGLLSEGCINALVGTAISIVLLEIALFMGGAASVASGGTLSVGVAIALGLSFAALVVALQGVVLSCEGELF